MIARSTPIVHNWMKNHFSESKLSDVRIEQDSKSSKNLYEVEDDEGKVEDGIQQ